MVRELLTPIVFVVFGIAVIAALATWRGDRLVGRLAWLLFAVTYSLSTALPVGLVARAWEIRSTPECQLPREHALYIALTGGASGRARTQHDIAALNQATYRRAIAAIDLASKSGTSTILISGGAEVGTTNEAVIAEQLIVRMGWPKTRLMVESRSSDTKTSAIEVAKLLQNHSEFASVVLVTSALHMRRAQLAYRQEGLNALSCATDYTDLFPMLPDALLPDAGVLKKSAELWKEMAGLVVYALQYALRYR